MPDLLSRWHCIDLFEPDGTAKLIEALGLRPAVQTSSIAADASGA